jgi:hypothetical protein
MEVFMKRNIGFIFTGLMLFFVNALSAQMSESQLQQMYMSYLREQGYQADIDSDGDIAFKAEGHNFYIIVDEDDPESFRILYPNFWEIESEDERSRAAQAASFANRTTKIAKVFLTLSPDDTSIDANIFLAKQEDFKLFFGRMIDVILLSRRKFVDEMQRTLSS